MWMDCWFALFQAKLTSLFQNKNAERKQNQWVLKHQQIHHGSKPSVKSLHCAVQWMQLRQLQPSLLQASMQSLPVHLCMVQLLVLHKSRPRLQYHQSLGQNPRHGNVARCMCKQQVLIVLSGSNAFLFEIFFWTFNTRSIHHSWSVLPIFRSFKPKKSDRFSKLDEFNHCCALPRQEPPKQNCLVSTSLYLLDVNTAMNFIF